MIRVAFALAACTALASPAFALESPKAGSDDPNVRSAEYSPSGRWFIKGVVSRQTTIVFSPKEEVYRVLFGPPGPWSGPDPKSVEKQPLGNVLPINANTTQPTSLQVITQNVETHEQRVYPYSLVAVPALDPEKCLDSCDPPDATLKLTMTYRADERAAAAKVAQAKAVEVRSRQQEVDAKARLAVSSFYGITNNNYELMGDEEKGDFTIAPTRVSDNQQSTKFRFPGNMPHPSIFRAEAVRRQDGSVSTCRNESAVYAHAVDDWVQVDSTSSCWVLRQGTRYVLGVVNDAPDRIGYNPRTGTSSPDVIRMIRQAP